MYSYHSNHYDLKNKTVDLAVKMHYDRRLIRFKKNNTDKQKYQENKGRFVEKKEIMLILFQFSLLSFILFVFLRPKFMSF